jgi:hypothetical protein
LCGLGERVQSPVGGPLLVFGLEAAAGLGDELARRVFGDQGDDPGALLFGDAGLAAGPGRSPRPSIPWTLKRWRRFRTVFGWQPSCSAMLAVRSPASSGRRRGRGRSNLLGHGGCRRACESFAPLRCLRALGREAVSARSLLPSRSAVRPQAYVYRL